nr:DUF2515 family protein [Bacillus sp. 03113]
MRSKSFEIKYELSKKEKAMVEKIKNKTNEFNKNNVTRTNAYYEFYRLHPEIHWAFLGHMVSRNGGWNMTDLKGDLIARLLNEKARQAFFSFLERGNWLIFQDAFPQFLIYEESLKKSKNLFHLLDFFNISVFMKAIWNYFWRYGDSHMLTVALVINEQSYLEKRVIQNRLYKDSVFNTIEFKLHELLSMNHIIFPYLDRHKTKLIGQTLHHFGSLHERIMLGKRLYSLLFLQKDLLTKVENWAMNHPHTGSRKDYYSHLFNDVREDVPGILYKRRLKKCQLRPSACRIYSPKLEFAWKNTDQPIAEAGDWYENWRVLKYLSILDEQIKDEIHDEYCETIEKIELAIIAKKTIFLS